jgi:hypothetical protein
MSDNEGSKAYLKRAEGRAELVREITEDRRQRLRGDMEETIDDVDAQIGAAMRKLAVDHSISHNSGLIPYWSLDFLGHPIKSADTLEELLEVKRKK